MPTPSRTGSRKRVSPQQRAARKAEEVAKLLHAFAATLTSLDATTARLDPTKPNPRSWWREQAGRFKDDPSFAAFVAKVQAARKSEG
jgi:hypothetical protein